MTDAALTMGGDLAFSASGDLLVSTGGHAGVERVLRRLLTNAGDYLWHPTYGAGLGVMVGQPANAARIAALVRGQMLQEKGVARSPAPTIDVQTQADNSVWLHVRYADADTGVAQTLSVPVS